VLPHNTRKKISDQTFSAVETPRKSRLHTYDASLCHDASTQLQEEEEGLQHQKTKSHWWCQGNIRITSCLSTTVVVPTASAFRRTHTIEQRDRTSVSTAETNAGARRRTKEEGRLHVETFWEEVIEGQPPRGQRLCDGQGIADQFTSRNHRKRNRITK